MRVVPVLLLLLFSSFSLHSQTAPAVRRVTAVQSVSLTEDSAVSSEDFQQAVHDIQGSRYLRDPETRIAEVARSAIKDRGYFKAEVATVATEVLNETARTRTIAVTLRIREGEQYRVAHITFAKDKEFSEAQLRQAFPIHEGDVLSDKKISEGVENIRKLFATKGYVEGGAFPKEIVADDASGTVSITMGVNEGPQFTIHGLTLEEGPINSIDGVVPKAKGAWTPEQAAKLQALASSYVGTHDVQGFIDAVNRQLAEMFPDYTQLQTLVGTTQGTAKHILTVNVNYPEEIPF